LEHRPGQRDLRHRPLGKGYSRSAKRATCSCIRDATRPRRRPETVGRYAGLRGIDPPILIRFGEILGNQLLELQNTFQASIAEHNYKGRYCCVYPIKVNQQRHVVEEIYRYGREYGFGLEAGSKPELLAVVAIADTRRRSSATASRTTSTSRW